MPIWASSGIPENPQVALFRRTFELQQPVQQIELQIFADTRYEVWVDGTWVGRGPARFSSTLREYDVYSLGTLDAGSHLIAVQVQWAPNKRRSESIAPALMVLVQGADRYGTRFVTMSSTQWRCQISPAWNQHAAPVDTRGLIGPTELLDLRLLPSNWNQTDYSDADWPQAAVQTASWGNTALQYYPPSYHRKNKHSVVYRPRSIAPLANVPIPITLLKTGRISPGFTLGEITSPPSSQSPSHPSANTLTYTLSITASYPAVSLTLETLAASTPPSAWARLDGNPLAWLPAGDQRPDVYQTAQAIGAGAHSIIFDQESLAEAPDHAPLLAISQQGISTNSLTIRQGDHAGQRTLLANFQSPITQFASLQTPALKPQPLTTGLSIPIIEFHDSPVYAILDMGRTVHGRLVAEVSGPAGSIIDIGWDERLWGKNQRPLPYPGAMYPEWNQVDSWVLDGAPRTITTIDARAGRYLLITAWGAQQANEQITLRKVQVYEERYPLTLSGEFHSSDPLLDQIWQAGVDVLIPNLTDAYTDTPWRERGQWWGDAYVEHQIARLLCDDMALLRRGLTYMANAMLKAPSPGMAPNNGNLHMLDYSMLWVHSLASYVEQTQDDAFAKRLYPALQQFMAHLKQFENPESGLLDIQPGHWSTTAYVDTTARYSRYGQSTALNALYVATLRYAAQLAGTVGDASAAQNWNTSAGKLQFSLNTLLFIPSMQHYLTHLYQGASFKPGPHAQAWPLAYELVPPGAGDGVAKALLETISPDPTDPNVGTYSMYWVLEALGKTGHIPQALDLIRLYYGRLLKTGNAIGWESFDANNFPQSSFSHGWAASPTYFLSTYVLGARPLQQNTWQVRPPLTGVKFASGAIPLPGGKLQVSWEHSRCGEFRLDVIAPPGTRGEVIIPRIAPDLKLVLNGAQVDQETIETHDTPDGIRLQLGSGTHRIRGDYFCRP